MKYIKAVACPVCGKMNNVPDNLEELAETVVFRNNESQSRKDVITKYLSDLGSNLRARILSLLEVKKKFDPNDWLDVECLSRKKPHGRHTFRYNLKTREVSK
jgi:hypothetical protein